MPPIADLDPKDFPETISGEPDGSAVWHASRDSGHAQNGRGDDREHFLRNFADRFAVSRRQLRSEVTEINLAPATT